MTTELDSSTGTELAASMIDVSKSYKHFKLKSIHFSVQRGTVAGLIGPNGAGKSTTMRILMGLVQPDTGTVTALGKSISSSEAAAKQDIGYFSDDMRLYKPETIGWHMQFVRSLYPTWDEAYATQLLDRFGLISQQIVKGLATDSNASVPLDASIWFIHLFRMGLFFLLSGYFAKLVMERKGLRHFLWNRCMRIMVPFLLFYPFLLAAMTVVIVFSLSYLVEPRGLMGFIAATVKESSGAQKREPLTTMHLWFLYYLMAFSAIGALLRNVKQLQLETLFRHSKWLFFCPLILIPGALAAGAPMPAPESFIPQWWPFAFYGLFYVAGWQLFGREQFLDSWRPYFWHVAALCMLLFVPYYMLMPVLDLSSIVAGTSSQVFWIRLVEACLTAYLSVLLTITSLLVGQRYLAGKSPFLSFVADSSYWVYLLHLPIVLFLQTLLVPMALPWWLKFSLVLVGTMIPCITTYVVFVRYTPLGWLLHGKRSFP